MSDRSVDPPGASDADTADGERRQRKSLRGLRLTGSHNTTTLAPGADLDLPDLDNEPLLSEQPSDHGDVEITASDEVEVSFSESEAPPAPAPVLQPESSMRVVRRRIRKVGSDSPPNDDPVLTMETGHTEPPDAPVAEVVVPARPSRPPPPRAPARPAMIGSNAASIFTAPTLPPMAEPSRT